MVKRLLLFLTLSSAFIFSFVGSATGLPSKPNIVILVADDMGWADVGYHGSTIRTPNIDRLQKDGAELDMHYVAPMCTPTRVGLLTGRYWSRFGNTKPSNERVLPWDIITLPKALKEVGYQTSIAGKWHLGSKPEWGPTKFGFDQSYGSLAGESILGITFISTAHTVKPGTEMTALLKKKVMLQIFLRRMLYDLSRNQREAILSVCTVHRSSHPF